MRFHSVTACKCNVTFCLLIRTVCRAGYVTGEFGIADGTGMDKSPLFAGAREHILRGLLV